MPHLDIELRTTFLPDFDGQFGKRETSLFSSKLTSFFPLFFVSVSCPSLAQRMPGNKFM